MQYLVLFLKKKSTFLEWELKQRASTENKVYYLDDFFFPGKANSDDCKKLMSCYINMCNEFGVRMAEEKTIGPCSVLIFLRLGHRHE